MASTWLTGGTLLVILYLCDSLGTSFVHGLAMAAPSCISQNLLNLFVIVCFEVFGAPLELVQFPCLPKVVKGGNARQVDDSFFVESLCKVFPSVAGVGAGVVGGVGGVAGETGVALPQSLDLLEEALGKEDKSMNSKGCEHPCQSDMSPTRMVRKQIEKVGQVSSHVQRW